MGEAAHRRYRAPPWQTSCFRRALRAAATDLYCGDPPADWTCPACCSACTTWSPLRSAPSSCFWSEKYWMTHFQRTPPGLIGSGVGLALGEYYIGPWSEIGQH